MSIYAAQDLLNALSSAVGGGQTWDVIQNHFCDLGFDVVNFGIMDEVDGSPKGFFTNMSDDWMRYYVNQTYNEIDPIVIHAVSSNDPFILTDENKYALKGAENPLASQMIEEVAEIGIRSSFIAPFHNSHPGHIVGFNLGSSSGTKPFRTFMKHNMESVSIATAVAQGFMPKLLAERDEISAWVPFNDAANKLTYREIETLNWLANGYRVDRIAQKMNISNATVNFHIKSIKSKLNANTREHAIAIAFMENLIH